MNHLEHCDALAEEVERFARAYEHADALAQVATCPGWRVVDVAEHLGRVHRWAYGLVSQLATTRIAPAPIELTERDVTPAWLREGGEALVRLLRRTDPEAPMWAWGVDQHARYWSRRQLHETLIHRADVELASGASVTVAGPIAVDAIDELLSNLASAAVFSPGVRELRGNGQRLSIRETDTGVSWSIELHDDGFVVSRASSRADASIVGPATGVLLSVYRRVPLEAALVDVEGDADLAAFWIDHSALE